MDDKEHSLDEYKKIIEKLRLCLIGLLQSGDNPYYDIEWLLLRCNDMSQYTGYVHKASALQLQKDVVQFDNEFPGLLPKELLDEFCPNNGTTDLE